LLELLHDEIALLSEPASAAAVSVDLIYNAVFFLKQALENHSLFCLLDKKTMQKVLLTFYSLSSSERSIEKTHVDCWKSYRLFLAENDTKDTHSLEDLTFLSLSAFGLLFRYRTTCILEQFRLFLLENVTNYSQISVQLRAVPA
jgi:hypothetical protein